jgi:hypothetical protein
VASASDAETGGVTFLGKITDLKEKQLVKEKGRDKL